MSIAASSEAYLRDYHRRRPGATAACFGTRPVVREGRSFVSPYACLAAAVPVPASVPGMHLPLTVLDLACGDGYLLADLAARGQADLSLVGIDMSEHELAGAERRLQGAATLLQARAQALPLADASVDVVLSHMALMLMDDIETVIVEIRRVLKPGGTVSAVVGGKSLSQPVLDIWLDTLKPALADEKLPAIRFGDSRMRTAQGVQELFGAGFREIVVQELDLCFDTPPALLWERLAGSYDVDRLPPTRAEQLRARFIAAIEPLVREDGTVACTDGLRQVTAS
jgi:ubiquinone/menaquinone biosynthesis C-methylase UbiE